MIQKLLLFVRSLFIIFSNSSKERFFTSGLRFLCLGMFFVVSFANAATRYAVNTGDWNQTSTWSISSGGTQGASVPVAGDIVIIERGYTVHITANAACTSLQVGSPGNTMGNFGEIDFTGAFSLTVSGNSAFGGYGSTARTGTITFSSGSSLDTGTLTVGNSGTLGTAAAGIVDMTSGGTLIVSGAITVNTVTGNAWTQGNGTVILKATNTLPTLFNKFNNLTITAGRTTFTSATTISKNLIIASGASVDLNAITTHKAGILTIDGVGPLLSSWGPTQSGAVNTNDVFFYKGSGIITVQLAAPYSALNSNFASYTNGTFGTQANSYAENASPTPVFTAPNGTIFINVNFASYGLPSGLPAPFTLGTCNEINSRTVTLGFLGNTVASIPITNATFGDPCYGTVKKLSIQATYTKPICKNGNPGVITGSDVTGGDTSGILSYAWYASNSPYTGYGTVLGTGRDYTPGPVSTTTYYKRIATRGINYSSTIVIVQVNDTPSDPTAVSGTSTICAGDATTLTVTGGSMSGIPGAGDKGGYAEWFTGSCGGTPVTGGVVDQITVSPATTTTYYVRYKNSCGQTNCITKTINVTPILSAVLITPTGTQNICPTGGTGSLLTAAETGGGTITSRQWGKRSVSGGTITTLAGATAATFTPTAANLGAGTWYVVCTSTPTCGSPVVSNEVIVNVSNLTAVSITPTATQTICATGTGSVLTAAETGGGAVTRQWGKRSTSGGTISPISGATAATYTPTGTDLGAGNWFIVCTSTPTCGTAKISNEIAITVNQDATLALTSGTASQTVCEGVAIAPFTYTYGGSAASVTTGTLPTGITATVNSTAKTVTITGTLSSTWNYSFATAGQTTPCTAATLTGTITVNPAATLALTSGTASQTVCEGVAIAPFTYTYGGSAASVTTGTLPTGITATVNSTAKTVTITGTLSSTWNYSFATAGQTTPCTAATLTGTITVNPAATLALTSGTATQTVCEGVAITPFSYTYGGSATGIALTGALPTGITATATSSKTITFAGTLSSTWNYSVETVGQTSPCTAPTLTGTITVNPAATLALTSGTASQTVCEGVAIVPFTYTYGGSAASVTTGTLPTGITATVNSTAKTVTFTGTLTSTWNYSFATAGQTTPCTAATLTGTITVNPAATLALTSGTASQTVCEGVAIAPFTYSYGGSAASVTTGTLPTGITATVNSIAKTVTFTGTLSSTWNYSFATAGQTTPCTAATLTGTITVNPAATLALTSGTASQTVCEGVAIVPFTYTYGGSAASVTTGTLPTGITATVNSTAKTVTFTGTLTSTWNYSFATAGQTTPCTATTLTGTITVNSAPTAPVATVTTQPTCGVPTGIISVTSPIAGYTYTIDGTIYTSGVFNAVSPGTYYVTAKNSSGCSSPASTGVIVNAVSGKTWNGSSDKLWATAANWTPSGIPGSSECVVIPSSIPNQPEIAIGDNIHIYSLTINSGSTLTVNSTAILTVDEGITIATGATPGNLIFENNSSLLQTNTANNINTGFITYKRSTVAVRRYDLTYWSTPVTNTPAPTFTLHDLSPLTLIDKYYSYDPNGGWVTYNNGTAKMIPGVGYNVRAPQTFDINIPAVYTAQFIGIPNNGDVTVVPVKDRYNLLGNPYPSGLDARKFIHDNNTGALYFWAHNTSPISQGDGTYAYSSTDYATQTELGSTGAIGTYGNLTSPSGTIGAGQAFFMIASSNTPITYTNAMRLGSGNTQFFKTSNSKEEEVNRLWLNFTNKQGAFKQALIGYAEGATNSWDKNYDGTTISGNSFIDFYSVNGTSKLTIQGRALPFNDSDLVPLGYVTKVEGEFTIAIDHADGLFDSQAVYLEDKKTGTITDLRASNYTFTTAIGTFADRFVLRYTGKTLGTGDFENVENGLLVSVKDKVIKVTSAKEAIKEVTIFDISGKLLYNKKKVGNTELQIPNLQASDEVLLVKVVLDNESSTTKKIIFQ